MSTPAPQYGVKTCGKLLEPPFDALGPCLLEPGHEERGQDVCMVKAPGMGQGVLMNVKAVDGPPMPQLEDHPWYSDAEVTKYRRISKRLFYGSLTALCFNLAVSVWQILGLFNVI